MNDYGPNQYQCNACGKVVTRDSDKRWMKSYCMETGRDSRLWRI